MLYYVIRRPLQTNLTHTSNQSKLSERSGSLSPTTFMPRYHYSRIVSNSPTNNLESISTRNSSDGQTTKSSMTPTTTTNNNNNNNQNSSYGSFKSTIIPLVTNNRAMTTTPNKREFIQIPVNREDGTSIITNNQTRSVPITYITESNINKNGNMTPKSTFTKLSRPNSKYFQYHMGNSIDEQLTPTNISRLPTVSRRLSLTVPVTTLNPDDDLLKQSNPLSPNRQIPIRFPPSTPTTPPVVTNSRITSAIQQSSQLSNALQRQKADIGDSSLSSPTLSTINNASQISSDSTISSPLRRAEVLAREAIQIMTRNQQQKSGINSEDKRSPPLARRVIINLKNNQSVSLDSRLSSSSTKPPLPIPSSTTRSTQRNNLYHIPILQEIQMLSHPSTINSDNLLQSTSVNNDGNYKNEFHMEIPVTVTNNNDQENNEINHRERILSTNNNDNHHHSHQTLKSILKRSSSRETVSRKNVSFMNA